jgi:hypothetical protein
MNTASAVLALICVALVAGGLGFVLGQFVESRSREDRKRGFD